MGTKPELYAGRYEVLDLLVVGPMAAIYRAKDRTRGHAVALKMLRKDLAGATLAVNRFRHEAKLGARISHVNVARVLDAGEHDGTYFVARELVEGERLDTLMEEKGPLPVERALSITVQLARGLAAAHERGVSYWGLAAENVLIEPGGRVVMTDLASGHNAVATSPEQAEGRAGNERSDLYALGALLYEMLTGVPPWGKRAAMAGGGARFAVPPTKPSERDPAIPADVSTLVLRLLERSPGARLGSATALEAAISMLYPPLARERGPTSPPPHTALRRSGAPESRGPSSRRTSAHSIAVLPLRDLGDRKRRYVADALASALADRLAACPRVRVLPRGADESEREADDPRVAGLRLGAETVLTGSLSLRANEDARFAVELTDVAAGSILWRAEIVRSPKELFKIADEVVANVTRALDARKSAAREPDMLDEEDTDEANAFPAAREAYAHFTREGADAAERGLASAFLRTPSDPVLACWLALAKIQRWTFDPGLGQGDEAVPVVAARIAGEVLKKSGKVAEAHLVFALLADAEGQPLLAMRHARDAIALSPTLAEAHRLVGQLRVEANDVIAGERDLDMALRLEPQVPTLLALARSRALLRDGDRAAESLYLVDARVPSHLAAALGRIEAAIWTQEPLRMERARGRALEATTGRSGPYVHAIRARAGLDVDREIGALTALAATPGATSRMRIVVMQTVCEERAAAGDAPAALAALRAVDEAGSIDALWLESCGPFAALRGLSGFSETRASILARAESVLRLLSP